MNAERQNKPGRSGGKSPDGAPKDLLIVYTGDGKGKTTAALGMALRAVGYRWKVCIIQFVKGSWKYGELEGLKRLEPEVELHVAGAGFVGIIDDKLPFEEHRRVSLEALELAREKLSSGDYRLVILDELNVAVKLGLVTSEELRQTLATRARGLHVVITGRDASVELIEQADLVTEMTEIKHPFQRGVLAQKGIDF
ncbi:MAG: cob(I)yrinic acid a,c-diamide adenosyltransferase [Candidatus Zixiibacteriota bacterium]